MMYIKTRPLFASSRMNTLMLPIVVTLFGFSTATNFEKTQAAGTLTVEITNFKSDMGQSCVLLFNQEEAFPKYPEKALRIVYSKISEKKSIVLFEQLLPGQYAVSVYHDENDNKKMDTNFFGIPKEGVGASNNAKGHFGPPKYKDAMFLFNGKSQTIKIEMAYL